MVNGRRAHQTAANAEAYRGQVAGSVSGESVDVEQSAVRELRAESAAIEQSALVVASANQLTIQESAAVAVVARDVRARDVTAVFLLAPRVTGTVRTVFDIRAAFAFGLGIVLGRQLLRMLRLN